MLDCIFVHRKDGWDIVYAPEKANPVEYAVADEQNIVKVLQKSVKPFDPERGLVHLKLIKTETNKYLFLDMYHALTDGTGIKNIFQDYSVLWEKENLLENTSGSLSEKIPYDDYFDLRSKREKWDTGKDRIYYEERYGSKDWGTIPTPDSDTNGPRECLSFPINKEIKFSNSILLTAALAAMAEYNDCKDVLATWTFHSRFTEEERKSCGLFIRDLPVGVHYIGQPLKYLHDDVKNQIKCGIEHLSYQYQMQEYCDKPVLYTAFQKGVYELPQLKEPDCTLKKILIMDTEAAEDALLVEAIDTKEERFLRLMYDSGMYTAEHMVKFGNSIKEKIECLAGAQ